MDYTPISQRRKLLIIVVSILLHILLLILMFIAITGENPFESSRHLDELANILGQSPQESEDATVVFYDDPASAYPGPQTRQATADTAFSADDNEQKKEAAHESSPQEIKTLSETESTITQQDETIRPDTPPEITEKEKIITSKGYERQPQKAGAQKGSGVGLTLADITKGFLKSVAQESGGRPTSQNSEELARQRYITRIWSHLRQSNVAYLKATHLDNDVNTFGTFVLTIGKDGTLLSAELQHPRKTADLAQFEQVLINTARKVGLFPPIPKKFNVDTFTINILLNIMGSAGTNYLKLSYGDMTR